MHRNHGNASQNAHGYPRRRMRTQCCPFFSSLSQGSGKTLKSTLFIVLRAQPPVNSETGVCILGRPLSATICRHALCDLHIVTRDLLPLPLARRLGSGAVRQFTMSSVPASRNEIALSSPVYLLDGRVFAAFSSQSLRPSCLFPKMRSISVPAILWNLLPKYMSEN